MNAQILHQSANNWVKQAKQDIANRIREFLNETGLSVHQMANDLNLDVNELYGLLYLLLLPISSIIGELLVLEMLTDSLIGELTTILFALFTDSSQLLLKALDIAFGNRIPHEITSKNLFPSAPIIYHNISIYTIDIVHENSCMIS